VFSELLRVRRGLMVIALAALPAAALAQQRPLVTEDPEPIGAGRVLIEGGFDAAHDVHYPVSGLEGNLIRLPTIGISIGLSSIAELQIDGGFFNHLSITHREPAPLSSMLTVTGDSTHDVEDAVVATKIRVLPEAEHMPALAIRFPMRRTKAAWGSTRPIFSRRCSGRRLSGRSGLSRTAASVSCRTRRTGTGRTTC
jgi:hypothetical protein